MNKLNKFSGLLSELGRMGAKARWAKTTPEQRSAYAKKIRAIRTEKQKKLSTGGDTGS